MKTSILSAGLIKRYFPIVSGQLKVGHSAFVEFYGETFKIIRFSIKSYSVIGRSI